MLLRARLGLTAIVLSLLAACGGGGGSNEGSGTPAPPPVVTSPPPAPAPAPTAEDLANARNSQLRMMLSVETNQLDIVWNDTFANETGFQVERRAPGGTWQLVTSAPSGTTPQGLYQWHGVIDASNNYRVIAVLPGYTVALETPLGHSEIAIEIATTPLSLQVSQASPVRGTAQLSLANATGIEAVSYQLGTDALGDSVAAPQFAFDWNTVTLPDGPHQLHALARTSAGAFIRASREIGVDNPHLAASLQVERVAGSWTDFNMNATATSDVGIQSVDFFLDGGQVHTLAGGAAGGEYSYTLMTLGIPSGTHVFRIVATDNAGDTVEAIRELLIDNPPALTLTSPAPGLIVANTLRVEGTFADDQPGATLTASLGNVTILQTSTVGAFDVNHSLTGLTPGEYTLTVRAVDSQSHETLVTRNVIVEASASGVELIATDVFQVSDTDQGAVLYEKLDGSFVLRDASGAEVTLQIPAGVSEFYGGDLSGGYVAAAAAAPPPAASGTYHIYLFDSTGQVTNVSEPLGATVNTGVMLRYPWLIWNTGSAGHFEIHNLATQARITVARPAAASAIGTFFHAFVTTPGAEQLLFWAQTGGTASAPLYDIFRYELASGLTHAVTSGGTRHRYLDTDNVRMAWRRSDTNSAGPNLMVGTIANPTAYTTLSSSSSNYMLEDGLLAWIEPNGDGTWVLKVDDGASTSVISSAAGNAFFVADGRVTFTQNGKVHVWKPATGRDVLLNTLPTSTLLHDNGIGFFTTGSQPGTLYRMLLP